MVLSRISLSVAALTTLAFSGRTSLSYEQQLRPHAQNVSGLREDIVWTMTKEAAGPNAWLSVRSTSTAGTGVVQNINVSQALSVSTQAGTCPGDFDGNGSVALADFLAFARVFGTRSGDANFNVRMDMDGSGAIDLSDFLAFAGKFGTTCPTPPANPDREALVALFQATDGVNWRFATNWLSDRPLSEWYGVKTDAGGRVTELTLHAIVTSSGDTLPVPPSLGISGTIVGNGLSGVMPAELASLSSLQYLNLSINRLTGPIPTEFGKLTRMQSLNLTGNQLTGSIPGELGNLSVLRRLALGANQLTGSIPSALGNLSKLEQLDLSGNSRLSGSLPGSFTGLVNLTLLYLGDTQICAPTDAAFQTWLQSIANKRGVVNCPSGGGGGNGGSIAGDRAALEALYNSTGGANWTNRTNWLSDRPLDEWHGVTINANGRVTGLGLEQNKLNGSIPAEMGNLKALQRLSLFENQLKGAPPASLADLTDLKTLWLAGNQFSGPLPSWLSDLTNLVALSLAGNQFSGPLPSWLGNLTNLQDLRLQSNRFSDELPSSLGNLTGLIRLYLSTNRFSGALPLSMVNLANLQQLLLDGTELCAPTDAEFQAWLRGVANKTGVRNCEDAASDKQKIYWTDAWADKIQRANLDGSGVEDLVTPAGQPFGLALDTVADKMYWTDIESNRIRRANLDGSGVEDMVTGVGSLGLAVDPGGGKMYWTVADAGKIRRANLDGSGAEDRLITRGTDNEPFILALDPRAGKMYWAATEGGAIRRANRDGSGVEDLVTGLEGPVGLALDPGAGKMYWTTVGGRKIQRANLDGSGVEDLITGIGGDVPIVLLALDPGAGKMYWTVNDRDKGRQKANKIQRANLDGSGVEDFVTGLSGPIGLALDLAEQDTGGSPPPAGDRDREALVALYNATNGANWTDKTNWLSKRPLGEWYGVTATDRGRVTELSLVDNNLRGEIPPELGGLSGLKTLALANSGLTGTIPSELGSLSNLETLILINNLLMGSIPSELGSLANLETLALNNNRLTGTVPPELGSLSNLEALALNNNRLTGTIPPELGALSSLEGLYLGNNPELFGPLPETLTGLSELQALSTSNTKMCLPKSPAFLAWLKSIEVDSRWCVARIAIVSGDVQLAALGTQLADPVIVQAIGVSDVPVEGAKIAFSPGEGHGTADPDAATTDRHGVAQSLWTLGEEAGDQTLIVAAAEGRSIRVQATATVPGTAVGAIEIVSGDRQSGNAVAALQRSVVVQAQDRAGAPLEGAVVVFKPGEGHGTANPTQAVTDASGQARTIWTLGQGDIQQSLTATTGAVSTRLTATALYSERAALEALYHATNGPEWTQKANWLTDKSLDQWFGVSADQAGRVVSLVLADKGISGPIPPAVSALRSLKTLVLDHNEIVGSVPPELGRLHNLEVLGLNNNRLSGNIPPELGDLSSLKVLRLSSNWLRGSIPSELTKLSNLTGLVLSHNRLEGRIPGRIWIMDELRLLNLAGNLSLEGSVPASLGELVNLEHLILSHNDLSGPLPEKLGQLRSLKTLALGNNRFSGGVPEEFSRLGELRNLELQNNPLLSGTLSTLFVSLNRLERLRADGTGICLPRLQTLSPRVRRWLDSISDLRLGLCGDGQALAYLTQAIQNPRRPVPLIAGEDALLRVLMTTATAGTREMVPPVRAMFFVDGHRVHETTIAAGSQRLLSDLRDPRFASSLSATANVTIPGHVIKPGLEMVVEIDPDKTLDPALGVPRRFPVIGRADLDVRDVGALHLVFVPLVYTRGDDDRRAVEIVNELSPNHSLLRDIKRLLPVGRLFTYRTAPMKVITRRANLLLTAVTIAKVFSGKWGHYWMGLMWDMNKGGVATTFGAGTSVAQPVSDIMAHELGHNFGLQHAPCGNPDHVDPHYPRTDGRIGDWGYIPTTRGGLMVPPDRYDLMAYCSPRWISAFSFTKALRAREIRSSKLVTSEASVHATKTLLVSGGIYADGTPYLNPAFVTDAHPVMPETNGPYRLAGWRSGGSELFSIAFDMPEIADGNGESVFVFALPVRDGWDSTMASLTLSGPGGRVEMREGSEPPMVIARDPETGELRAVLHNVSDLPAQPVAQKLALEALVPEPELDVMVSRGLPGAADWRR